MTVNEWPKPTRPQPTVRRLVDGKDPNRPVQTSFLLTEMDSLTKCLSYHRWCPPMARTLATVHYYCL